MLSGKSSEYKKSAGAFNSIRGILLFCGSSRTLGEEQLGGASADAQSYWQGRFAACTFVGDFLGTGRTRDSWGVAPNPTRDAVP